MTRSSTLTLVRSLFLNVLQLKGSYNIYYYKTQQELQFFHGLLKAWGQVGERGQTSTAANDSPPTLNLTAKAAGLCGADILRLTANQQTTDKEEKP